MKCDNCPSVAVYELRQKPTSQFYCASHLPWFVKLSRDLNVKIFEVSSSTPVAPEPIVETPIVEELVVEEPKATEESKKSVKKKAEVKETTEEK
jgi:hypothetical protein